MEDMKGAVIRNPKNRIPRNVYHRFDFRNETGDEIRDFWINTNKTWGNDPDITGVKVKSTDNSVTYHDQEYDDVVSVHFKLRPCIPKGGEFKILVRFDDEWEGGERIEFLPSDPDGAAILGPPELETTETSHLVEELRGLQEECESLEELLSDIRQAASTSGPYEHIGLFAVYAKSNRKLRGIERRIERLERELRRRGRDRR